jgi:hypothetical protein
MDRLGAKYDAQNKRLKNNEAVERSIQSTTQKRAIDRQHKVESHRAQMRKLGLIGTNHNLNFFVSEGSKPPFNFAAAIIESRKQKEEHLWVIVRKFFNRWVDKVRQRRARRPDAMHKSLWDIREVFDETVNYLRKESGYGKEQTE